jgi:hypothetical protein
MANAKAIAIIQFSRAETGLLLGFSLLDHAAISLCFC